MRLRTAGASPDAPDDRDRLAAVLGDRIFALPVTEAIIATEIELKLAARARDLPALERALLACAGSGVNGAPVRLVSTYFDTPEHTLARRGLVLRVRQHDGHFVQTVKVDDASASTLFARGEWEDRIAGEVPDPAAAQSGRFFDDETAFRLVPLFRTDVMRHVIPLSDGTGTRIEGAIDRGRIEAGPVGEPISEVELELKQGRASALYDIALNLLGVAPVRLERRSKAERGYRLAAAERGAVVVHSAPVALDPAMSSGDALRRIGLACLDHVMCNEAAALAGMPEGVHQMRVGVRRLRAALSAFSPMLPDEQRRWAADELRWLADALGTARNLDVFEHELVEPAGEALPESDGIEVLVDAAEQRRQSAYGKAIHAIRSRRYTASLLKLLRWFETSAWRDGGALEQLDAPIATSAAHILDRRRRVAKRRGKGFDEQSPAQRHHLRIALKKLRYAVEMLGGLYEAEPVAQFLKPLKRLQDELGDANDVRVGHEIVADLAKRERAAAIHDAGKTVLDWHEDRLAKREHSLRRRLERSLTSEAFWSR